MYSSLLSKQMPMAPSFSRQPQLSARRSHHGFNLVELMIVVAIIAILAAIAIPAYTRYITRTRRVATESCMSQVSSYMERYYTSNLRYDQNASGNANVLPTLDCMSANNTGFYYSYNLSNLDVSTFTVNAVPSGSQATKDTACGNLSINQANQQVISGNSTAAKCFSGGD
jgi:type IV pilus assembly protein PilE